MPLVGVLSKGDTVTVLIKHTDEVYELRKVAKLDTLLETIKKNRLKTIYLLSNFGTVV